MDVQNKGIINSKIKAGKYATVIGTLVQNGMSKEEAEAFVEKYTQGIIASLGESHANEELILKRVDAFYSLLIDSLETSHADNEAMLKKVDEIFSLIISLGRRPVDDEILKRLDKLAEQVNGLPTADSADNTTVQNYPTLDNYDKAAFEIEGTVLKKYKGSKADVIIPDGVTVIGGWAFDGFQFDGCKSVKSITLPNSLVEICIAAFQGCISLKEVKFGNKLKYIYGSAFASCSRLEKIILPDSLVYLGRYAFYRCSSLANVYVPSSISRLMQGTFCECISLTDVDLPFGLTVIEDEVFSGCENLINIKIPNSVVEIGFGLEDCKKLLSYERGVMYFNNWAVGGENEEIEEIEEIFVRNNTIGIVDRAFYAYELVEKVNLPEGLKYIGDEVFFNEPRFINKLPNSVIRVGSEFLSELGCCYKLKNENGIYYIDNWVVGCEDVEEAIINDSTVGIADGAFARKNKLKNIKLPNGLRSIGSFAFSECDALKKIFIPKSVQFIGAYAFNMDEIEIMCERYEGPWFSEPQGWIKGWDEDYENFTIKKEKKISFGCKK